MQPTLRRFRNPELANRLVPLLTPELEALARAAAIQEVLGERFPQGNWQVSTALTHCCSHNQLLHSNCFNCMVGCTCIAGKHAATLTAYLRALQLRAGSGPYGIMTPADVTSFVSSARSTISSTWPQLSGLLQMQGATDLLAAVSNALVQRFTARMIKFAFGMQEARAPA